jgi:hypothetical protein
MDNVTLIRIVAGVLFFAVLYVLIRRRKTKLESKN